MSVSLEDQIKCVRREITMRKTVYPRWVRSGKMSETESDLEIRRMSEVLKTLQNLLHSQQGDFFKNPVSIENTGIGKLAP
jgi:hypothetical protein